LQISFTFHNPHPTDHAALTRLLNQLFGVDAELLNDPSTPGTSALADLIIAQPGVGTTGNVDGVGVDPYAFLTVLSMDAHRDNPAIGTLTKYVLRQTSTHSAMHAALRALLDKDTGKEKDQPTRLGLVLSERLVNMPVQVVPPMYRMLVDELRWAVEDNEPFDFTHLLFISRVYRLSQEEEEAMQAASRGSKRARVNQNQGQSQSAVYPFHPEDEYIQKLATHTHTYTLTQTPPGPRASDAFGLDTAGRVMLVPAARLAELVSVLGDVYPP
ncbi:p21-C-terminal region-binding protein-domain-containing protein, partial [Hygrophoropsis aurantiaca]